MNTVREITADDFGKWDDFLRKSPQGSIFHTIAWNQMLVETDPRLAGFLPLANFDKDGNILAGLVIPYRLVAGRKVADRPTFGYGGPVLADSLRYTERHHAYSSHTAVVGLLEALESDFDFVRFWNAPDIWDVRSYMFQLWKLRAVYTHQWTCAPIDEAWARIKPEWQSLIRTREQSDQLKVDESGQYDAVYISLASRGKDALAPEVIQKRLQWLRSTGNGQLYVLGNASGRALAMTLAILSRENESVYLWHTVSEGNASQVLPALFWQLYASLAGNFKRIDLGPSDGIAISQLKDALGCNLLPTFLASYCGGGQGTSRRKGESKLEGESPVGGE